MDIIRAGSQPSGKGPAEYFTGTVRIDPLNAPPEPARVSMALVTFEPGARTAWHTPARADAHRHRRMRPGAARGWPDRGNPPWRRCVVPTRGEALARGRAGHGNEPHSHPGKAERLAGGLDGAGDRRAISGPAHDGLAVTCPTSSSSSGPNQRRKAGIGRRHYAGRDAAVRLRRRRGLSQLRRDRAGMRTAEMTASASVLRPAPSVAGAVATAIADPDRYDPGPCRAAAGRSQHIRNSGRYVR